MALRRIWPIFFASHLLLPWSQGIAGVVSGAVQPEQACPDGHFRSAAILFGCDRAAGTSHFLLAPAAYTEVAELPAGLRDFHVQASSDMSIDLQLLDAATGTYIVNSNSKRLGVVNNFNRTGTFKGSNISFSGDDASSPVVERLSIDGEISTRSLLGFYNRDSAWAMVSLNYRFSGVAECQLIPYGCSRYDANQTQQEVVSWSQWARSKYSNADEAWLMRGAPHAQSDLGGVPWHRWPMIWERSTLAPAWHYMDNGNWSKRWQCAFHYVDADRNAVVSQNEFEAAYHGVPFAQSILVDKLDPCSGVVACLTQLMRNNWKPLLAGLFVIITLVGVICSLRDKRSKTRGARVLSRDSDSLASREGSDNEPIEIGMQPEDCLIEEDGNEAAPAAWAILQFWPPRPAHGSFRYGPVPSSEEQPYRTTHKVPVLHAAPSFSSTRVVAASSYRLEVKSPNKELDATPSTAAPSTPTKFLSTPEGAPPSTPWAAVFTPDEWARATKDVPHAYVREPQLLTIG